MPIDPVKIPQNVYIEDRIIGPITLRQIIISLLGTGLSYGMWSALQKSGGGQSIILSVLAWVPCAIALVFAFVRINDISMFRICLLMLEHLDKPTLRTWSPRTGIQIIIRAKAPKKTDEEKKRDPNAVDHLTQLSEILDKGPEEDVMTEHIPVNKSRISAQETDAPSIDNFSHEPNDTPKDYPGMGSLIRDIHPAR